MRTFGLIGGLSWEPSLEYYRNEVDAQAIDVGANLCKTVVFGSVTHILTVRLNLDAIARF
jgi:aspartate/glutamate racemase